LLKYYGRPIPVTWILPLINRTNRNNNRSVKRSKLLFHIIILLLLFKIPKITSSVECFTTSFIVTLPNVVIGISFTTPDANRQRTSYLSFTPSQQHRGRSAYRILPFCQQMQLMVLKLGSICTECYRYTQMICKNTLNGVNFTTKAAK
jgi:hypothetical protein